MTREGEKMNGRDEKDQKEQEPSERSEWEGKGWIKPINIFHVGFIIISHLQAFLFLTSSHSLPLSGRYPMSTLFSLQRVPEAKRLTMSEERRK